MYEQQILQQIRENARDISTPKSKIGTLLSVDMDSYYLEEGDMSEEFKANYATFLDNVREHFDVVHIWHFIDYEQRERTMRRRVGSVEICSPATRLYGTFNTQIKPEAGEKILGKNNRSAFKETDLAEHIDKEMPVFVTGTLGYWALKPDEYFCIDRTIEDGLREEYNMIAIEDLINGGYKRRDYEGHGRIPVLQSQDITKEINVQKLNTALELHTKDEALQTLDHHQA